MKIKISREANHDIENIWNYTFQKWSLEQADRYFNLIMDEMEFIAENPKSGKDYSQVRKGYLRVQVKSHFIFYRINQIENAIEIIRILHQKMGIETTLND